MCGILAVVGDRGSKIDISHALKTLKRRGPDNDGITRLDGCVLGHTILSIIDPTGGAQPMRDSILPHTISYNGEVYNFRELREELKRAGHTFATSSDTEVILKAYAEYGERCVEKLDGMFAFVIWDQKQQTLFFARDRFGEKPLYYAHDTAGNLIIASEIKAIEAMGVTPKIDPSGIDAYLTFMYQPPCRTIYTNVHTLPPAHAGTYKDGKITSWRYWALQESPLTISYDDAKEEARRLIISGTEKRMIADVEIGAFLSGGVDSTLVTAYAQRYTDRPIKTFSLGYGDYINELPYAQEAADVIGTDHHTLEARDGLMPELERIQAYFDEPHGDSAAVAQHLLSEFTAPHVKVALAGDGGDELFMGYGWYWAYWNKSKLAALRDIFRDQFDQYLRSVTVFNSRERAHFQKHGRSYNTPLPQHLELLAPDAHKINAYDFASYLPGQLLTKVDRTSMMHGLEVRCPLLDHHLAEFAYNLPLEHKISKNTGKFILKDLLAEVMPRTFVDRKKQGFGGPVRKWFGEPAIREYVARAFANGPLYEFLERERVLPFVEYALRGTNQKASYQLWVLLCLQIWLTSHEQNI